MVRRVVLDANGLRISKPGFHADTAALQNLQYSSEWSQGTASHTNELDCNWNETPFRTYSLGKTFPSPPVVYLEKVESTNESGAAGIGALFWGWRYEWTDLDDNYQIAQHSVTIYTTASALMIKSINHSSKPSQVTPPPFRLRYIVMDYNI